MQKRFWPILAGLALLTLVFFAKSQSLAATERLSDLLFDHFQRQAPREYLPDMAPVRIIDIDNESIERIGQWPWPRHIMAKLNDRLNQAGAGVIAYDIIFSEPDRTSPENLLDVLSTNPTASGEFDNIKNLTSHDRIFADSLARSNAVLGFFLLPTVNDVRPRLSGKFGWSEDRPDNMIKNYNGAVAPLPELEAGAAGEGFVSFHPTGDGIIRQAPLIYRIGEDYYRSLALDALRAGLRLGGIAVKSADGSGEAMAGIDSSSHEIAKLGLGPFTFPTLPDGSFRVYYSDPKPERYIPAWKILSDDVSANDWVPKVAGHLVFVGTGADGLKDLVATPIRAREPGVLVHAQMVEQALGGQFLSRTYEMIRYENLVLVLSGLLLVLALPFLRAVFGAILTFTLMGSIYWGSWIAFKDHQLLFSPVYPLLALLAIFIVMTLISFYMTETERSQIRGAFSMYLSPTMVKKVSENPELLTLGGEERNMTILFLDVRSFSKISESLEPQEITTFLNLFLTPMTNILQAGQATIDKYIGDAIVAFWNAPLDDPDHEANAARAVLNMQTALDELNATYQNQTDIKWPDEVKMGIGLNTGICCVGNLGSDQRFSYSMIGDAANLASRIEGLTKQYKVTSMIGSTTADALGDFALLEADNIKVVGRQTPERIFILVGDEKLAGTNGFRALRSLHDKFLGLYRNQDWAGAEALLSELKNQAEPFGCAGYYDVIGNRISVYKTTPPPKDWDGVFEAKSK